MPDIPDDALWAAVNAFCDPKYAPHDYCPPGEVEGIHAALEAALPHLIAGLGHPVTIHRSHPSPIQVDEKDGYLVYGPGQGSIEVTYEWPCHARIKELEDGIRQHQEGVRNPDGAWAAKADAALWALLPSDQEGH